jgi:CspA family cold shock protein
MSDSFSKKENLKKRAEKKKEKAMKREERKTQNNKGASLESMFAYVDEFGVLTTTPPDARNKIEINPEDILLGAKPIEEEEDNNLPKTGFVSYYSDKGYGFITDDASKEKLFFHNSDATESLKMKDKVSFEIKRTPRGDNAVQLKKLQ